jgi:hypothetical protein
MVSFPAMPSNAELMLVARWLIPEVQEKAIRAMSDELSDSD